MGSLHRSDLGHARGCQSSRARRRVVVVDQSKAGEARETDGRRDHRNERAHTLNIVEPLKLICLQQHLGGCSPRRSGRGHGLTCDVSIVSSDVATWLTPAETPNHQYGGLHARASAATSRRRWRSTGVQRGRFSVALRSSHFRRIRSTNGAPLSIERRRFSASGPPTLAKHRAPHFLASTWSD